MEKKRGEEPEAGGKTNKVKDFTERRSKEMSRGERNKVQRVKASNKSSSLCVSRG